MRRFVALAALGLSPQPALVAQEAQAPSQSETLRVFLDCQTFYCDFDHFRREIVFVDWMRNRQDADVHILGTGQPTGGGGREFTFTFIGLRQFVGRRDTLRYTSRNTDTESEIRDRHVRMVKLGLVRYAVATPAAGLLNVTYSSPTTLQPATPASDPWDLWTFRVGFGGNLFGEQQQRFLSYNGSLSANRTAANVKWNFRVFGSFNRSEQELTTGTFVSTSRNITATQSVTWSLSPRWSAGMRAGQASSTFLNQDGSFRGGPAIEYNVYSYDESTRRQLTFRYLTELASFNYEQETVFGRTAETRPLHQLDVGLQVLQPWGQIHASANALQYLHDLSKHRLMLSGFLSFRVVRGLTFDVGGNLARIKDQLYLPGAGLSDEQILIRLRQLQTSFRYSTFMQFGFQFGSVFANIVNPRMRGIDQLESSFSRCICF